MRKYEKKGYLTGDFKIFHLSTCEKKDFEYHYHDFDKIVIFVKGNVTYSVEGMNYKLAPYDIVLVRAGQVHRPVVHDASEYERIIIYISPQFIEHYRNEEYDLSDCFKKAEEEKTSVFRKLSMKKSILYRTMAELENSFHDEGYASKLHQEVLFLNFMIQLNRAVLENSIDYRKTDASNMQILNIVSYMNRHLTESLSVEMIAEHFYINRYYLMHLFKEETGDTIGNYITNKRLILARRMIAEGKPVTQACYEAGFTSYSNFSRAYKKCFGETAGQKTRGTLKEDGRELSVGEKQELMEE